MSIRVEGLPQAQRALRQLAADMPRSALAALKAGGAVFGEGAERRAPKLSDALEGTIGESIQTQQVGPTAIVVGTNHGLAKTLEDGGEITPSKAERLAFEGRGGLVRPGRVTMPARPFMRPTADEDKAAIVGAIRRSAGRHVEAAARRAARR